MEKLLKPIFCHLLGDYVLQTEYIANTKGTNWWHLVVHCLLYILPFCVCFSVDWRLFVLFGTHFMIDAVKSRLKAINYVVDQLLHIALLAMYYW